MSTLDAALDVAVEGAKMIKQEKASTPVTDLSTVILAYRGRDLVSQVYPQRGQHRDDMLAVAHYTAAGFNADVLALVYETWYATAMLNPRTGQTWGAGEMQDAVENHDARRTGLVVDSVMVQAYNRGGDVLSRYLPYRITNSRKVHWLTRIGGYDVATINASDIHAGGYVVDQMRSIMASPTLMHVMSQTGLSGDHFGFSAEATLAHSDCAIAKWLAGADLGLPDSAREHPLALCTLAFEKGSERAAVITESMAGLGEWHRPP